MPLILGAQSAVATGFSVDNSCRFNDGDAVQLYRAISVEGNRKVWTISFWFKKGNAVGCRLWAQGNTPSQNPSTMIELGASGAMTIFHYNGSYPLLLEPTAKLTDPNAWYHLCLSFDSTPATPSSASIKFFINGTQQTAFGTETYPSQDFLTEINNTTYDFYAAAYDGGNYFDGYMAEFCLIDGTAYDASTFGEFDEDSPTIWKPKDFSEDVTFGTNGFYLDFKDSSALGNDVSGNNNDLTATNLAAVDQATDSPTNNFCVMNPLDNALNQATFSEGNCKLVTASSPYYYNTGTFGLSSGKWYYECYVAASAPSDYNLIGIAGEVGGGTAANAELGGTGTYSYGYHGNNGKYRTDVITGGGAGYAYGATYSTSVIGVYIDLDNNKLYFAKDGAIQDSGTGIAIGTAPPHGVFYPAAGEQSSSGTGTLEFNFGGSPAFTISSGNADAKGYGNFEYSPNDGGSASFDGSAKDFLAICTKNLGSDGG